MNTKKNFEMSSIGQAHAGENGYWLEIDESFRQGLTEMDRFSHVLVFWWATGMDNEKNRKTLLTSLPYAQNQEAGVFACRSEYRPNPIAVTVCQILDMDIDSGKISVPYIDAHDGTPIVDLKPYIPVSERVRDFKVPRWFRDWPEWYEDAYKLQDLFARMADQQCGS